MAGAMLRRLLIGARPARTAMRVAIVVTASAVVFGLVLRPVRTHGISMLPTIGDDQIVLVNTLAYTLGASPRRGDVVAIRLAGPNVLYLKRVIGLPGERVRIVDGQVAIDGLPLHEPYVRQRLSWRLDEVPLGPDEYFVMGDNRGMRQDLHDFGRVSRSRIVGKVAFR